MPVFFIIFFANFCCIFYTYSADILCKFCTYFKHIFDVFATPSILSHFLHVFYTYYADFCYVLSTFFVQVFLLTHIRQIFYANSARIFDVFATKYLHPEYYFPLKADDDFQNKPDFELDLRMVSRCLKSFKITRAVSR